MQIANGESLYQVAIDNPTEFIRYHGGIKAYHSVIHSSPRDSAVPITVHWWFGPTGVGKSRKAFETYGQEAYVKMDDNWWDGYEGQSTVIFDDYRPGLMPFSSLLRVLDRYPYRVRIKGTSTELSATCFVLTTTSRPEVLWHSRTEEKLAQLLRRLTTIVEFSASGEERILKSPEFPYVPLSREEIDHLIPHPLPFASSFNH